ncbi:hypothetical protein FRC98_08040 [Lujinxingia vulgaris]|uniref:Uncharacterized protein n=1 Tax=Lujinxingia vulgaris TaxID=2600176 RepID=A0A5C6XJ60_9DELT|nr:hypothetical protein [Lujinxingia vulgaris]TXD37629.1 hypothetical protein FRC98_08040 [Lujinxingia vulgaris]
MHLDRARTRPTSGAVRRAILTLLPLLTIALLSACSGVDAPIVATDTGEDATESDASEDTSPDPVDSGADADDADTAPDPCPVCCAGTARCGVGGAREVCNETGTAYEAAPCDEGTSCSAGVCEPDPICTPGESRCVDAQTQLTCRATGLAYRTDTCTGGQVCAAGECRNGLANGAECTSDTECAGGSCLNVGGTSYCTSACQNDPCGDHESCWIVDGINHQLQSHCLERCQVSCAREDMSCVAVRTEVDGEIAWANACLPDSLKSIGARCTSDAECASETCRLDYFSDSDDNAIGYCTRSCEAGGCPEGSACIGIGGEQWCQPRCSDEVCPLDPTRTNLRIHCPNREVVGSIEPTRVCMDRND